eukprot:7096789-Pyramimonas_sp.AAC.1
MPIAANLALHATTHYPHPQRQLHPRRPTPPSLARALHELWAVRHSRAILEHKRERDAEIPGLEQIHHN